MGIWFLAATNGFYDDRLAAPPKGAVLVPKSTYQSLLAAQERGATIVVDKNGSPVALAPPAQRMGADAAPAPAPAVSVAERLAALEHMQTVILQHLGLRL